MKTLFFILLSLNVMAQNENSGVYLNFNDYVNNKLSYQINCKTEKHKIRMNDFLKRSYITVIHNGVLVQNHTMIQGVTNYIGQPTNPVHGKAPIHLQDHSNAVSFRNVWIREL